MGKGDYYYESMRTYWGVLKLLSDFHTIKDYTDKCILNPKKYHSLDVMENLTFVKHIPRFIVRAMVPFAPDLVMLAEK